MRFNRREITLPYIFGLAVFILFYITGIVILIIQENIWYGLGIFFVTTLLVIVFVIFYKKRLDKKSNLYIEEKTRKSSQTTDLTTGEYPKNHDLFRSVQKLSRTSHSETFLENPTFNPSENSLGEEFSSINSPSKNARVISRLNYKKIQDFHGVIDGQFCPICKLQLRKEEKIIQCKTCHSLFHKKHLIDWLTEHTDCPVCQTKLI